MKMSKMSTQIGKKNSHLEIEKKWFVDIKYLPIDLNKYKSVNISQCYISKKPSIRLRKIGNNYIISIKQKTSEKYVRLEIEFKISKIIYNNLLKSIESGIIQKTRYYIPYGKHTIELDVFDKELKGLCYAEVEFNNIKDLQKFVAPNWFKKDLSNIKKYSNESLAYSIKKY